ncbi:MAG: carbohydrate ABC transporter permease, partial [Acidobacteria bacterium]|nr:carbohydrate ABC transporter permease [Acidobacteriota bacterium]
MSKARKSPSVLLHVLLVAGASITLFPLLWMASASLMTAGEATSLPPHLVPHAPTLDQYRQLFIRLDIGRAFFSSAVISLTVMFGSVLFSSMAGYAFAKLRFRGRERMFGILLTALVIPPQVGMLPLFLFMKQLHL